MADRCFIRPKSARKVGTGIAGSCILACNTREEAARKANCSAFHFYRMFEVIAGINLGEYVHRRRLSEAAMALAAGQEKVIDVALRCGYDSPDAFARAFRREFGCLPSQARKNGIPLHSYPPLWFQITLRGEQLYRW